MTAAAIARAFEVVLPADVAQMVGCSYRTVRNMRVSGRIPGGRVVEKWRLRWRRRAVSRLMKSLPGTCPPGQWPVRFRPPPARRRTAGKWTQFQALEKKRIEDARIAALIREDKELSLAMRRGELIPAADVQARLGAGRWRSVRAWRRPAVRSWPRRRKGAGRRLRRRWMRVTGIFSKG